MKQSEEEREKEEGTNCDLKNYYYIELGLSN
jgi:hypothetical protein